MVGQAKFQVKFRDELQIKFRRDNLSLRRRTSRQEVLTRPLRGAPPNQKSRQKFQRSWRQDVNGKKMRNGAGESQGKAGVFGDSLVVEGPRIDGGIGDRS